MPKPEANVFARSIPIPKGAAVARSITLPGSAVYGLPTPTPGSSVDALLHLLGPTSASYNQVVRRQGWNIQTRTQAGVTEPCVALEIAS